jgi:hypothetical protein
MDFAELNMEQRRRLVDIRQVFEAWRTANAEFRHSYRGTMRWRHIHGRDYLYRISGKVEHSLGPRDDATERIKAEYTDQRARLRRRLTTLDKRLGEMAPMNRAADLGRVPQTSARILRKLDAEGLLGRHLFVVGTHALYAYEAASGVVFDAGLTATDDIDLLWDARRRLSLALVEVRAEGVLGLLKKVDRSFAARRNSFRAINDEGYYVDLIRPLEKDEARSANARIGDPDDDLEPAAIAGLQWLINAPKFERTVVGADGRPLWMSSIDPRAFALHKYWLAQRDDRDPLKRHRDAAQAKAVAAVATQYLGLTFKAKDLSALPIELIHAAEALSRDNG